MAAGFSGSAGHSVELPQETAQQNQAKEIL